MLLIKSSNMASRPIGKKTLQGKKIVLSNNFDSYEILCLHAPPLVAFAIVAGHC